jgi:hypothetical protein
VIAAFLEAEGYTVWWDESLLSGQAFRKVIMTELGLARAVIVIWSERSIHSDWVQSEAGRGHADKKLISVKTAGTEYKDIPPPFDNLHAENVAALDKILTAVAAHLVNPESQRSTLRRLLKRTRFELLSWFGIVGAIISLASNLQGIITLAKWVRQLFESWVLVFKYIWSHILFFVPKVYGSDAMLLTFILFTAINMISCLRKNTDETATKRNMVSIFCASAFVIIFFGFGLYRASGDETGNDQGYYFSFVQEYIAPFLQRLRELEYVQILYRPIGVLYALIVFALVPITTIAILYVLLTRRTALRLSAAALSWRLWRIVIGIGLLIGLNYFSLWIV